MCPYPSGEANTAADGTPPRRRARRSDAIQNRQLILGVARDMLSEADGAEQVTMQAIAKRAEVGQGTLYRHFADREQLVLAVYEADVARLIETADALSSSHPPREALRLWLIELAAYGRLKRGISQMVLAAATREDVATTWRPRVLGTVQRLLDAGRERHELRDDVDAQDVWDLVAFLWQTSISPQRAERLTGVLMDGLATGSAGDGSSASGSRLA